MTNFEKLNLNAKILSALEKKGYTTPTEIQQQAIPHILQGKDFLGIAQTGTGKTAAFALPILDNLTKSKIKVAPKSLRTLILTPTRELATQITDNIKIYGKDLGLSHTVILGGVSISNQVRDMQRGFDIVVATPGRLLDLVNRGAVKFNQLEIFTLDEADRMLDMGFIHDVKKIISKLPAEKQTLFFSATMPSDISKLAASILKSPIKIEITPQSTTVEKIDQRLNMVEKGNKPLLLKSILEQEGTTSTLVFSKTKHGANRIMKFLETHEIKVAAIHGNKSQSAREKALNDFRRGKVSVLIATDIAARGIDIPAISHVINYDIPNDPQNYVHRIGRTARAGRSGISISFCDNSERALLRAIEKTIRYEIPVDKSHPFHGSKSLGEIKEFIDDREERPRGRSRFSGARTNSEKRHDERPTSFFGQNRRRKDGFEDGRASAPSKPRFSKEGDKNESYFSKKKTFGDDKKASFSGERRGNSDERRERPNFGEKRFDGERRERGNFSERRERPAFSENSERLFDGRKKRDYKNDGNSDFTKKDSGFSDSRKKTFGETRKPFGDDKKSSFSKTRKFDGKKEGFSETRKPFGEFKKSSFGGDQRKRSSKPAFDGEKGEHGNFSERRERPAFGEKRFDGERRERPANSKHSFDGRKKSFGNSDNKNSRPAFSGAKKKFGGANSGKPRKSF